MNGPHCTNPHCESCQCRHSPTARPHDGAAPEGACASDPSVGLALCGPECLHEVLRRLGVDVYLAELARRCKTSRRGTTVRDLVTTARAFGLDAEVYKIDIGLLTRLLRLSDLVVIAYVREGHFVLVERASDGRLTVWDPSHGSRESESEAFQGTWKGVCIVVAAPSGS